MVLNKIIGSLKILIGLLGIAVGVITLVTKIKEGYLNVSVAFGSIIGFILFESYFFTLVYNGWTAFSPVGVKYRSLILINICLGAFFSIFILIIVQGLIVKLSAAFLPLLFLIHDLHRLKKINR